MISFLKSKPEEKRIEPALSENEIEKSGQWFDISAKLPPSSDYYQVSNGSEVRTILFNRKQAKFLNLDKNFIITCWHFKEKLLS